MSRQGPVYQLKKSNKPLNHGIVIVKTEYNSTLQCTCMCKTTHITLKPKYHSSRKLPSLVIIFFPKLFEKHVISINCTKRAGNFISKSQ